MHINAGLPLISAEQEPHLPALQFHAHCEVVGLVGLHPVDCVEDHHPLGDRRDVVLELAARRVTAPDVQGHLICWVPAVSSAGGAIVMVAITSSPR